MIKLIAFDWNGTLLHDTAIVVKSTNYARKHYGYPPISINQYRKTFTIPVIDFWLANGGKKEDMKTEHKIFHPAYERLAKNMPMRKGAKKILQWLKKNNMESIIYSNHTLPEINKKLGSLKIKSLIKEVIARHGAEDTSHLRKRTKQEKLRAYIRKHKIKPNEIVSVGDTSEEIETGHNLGLHTVAITQGESTTIRLKKHHPDFLIHNMLELKKIITKLNN